MDVDMDEGRRIHALEMACENFNRCGLATSTEMVIQQAKAFEEYLRGAAKPNLSVVGQVQ